MKLSLLVNPLRSFLLSVIEGFSSRKFARSFQRVLSLSANRQDQWTGWTHLPVGRSLLEEPRRVADIQSLLLPPLSIDEIIFGELAEYSLDVLQIANWGSRSHGSASAERHHQAPATKRKRSASQRGWISLGEKKKGTTLPRYLSPGHFRSLVLRRSVVAGRDLHLPVRRSRWGWWSNGSRI